MQRTWGRRELGTFEEQNEGEWGQKSGQLGESQNRVRRWARCGASEAVRWSLGSILSTMGSQGKDLKHRGNMT